MGDRHWAAVEEASELLSEKRFEEGLLELKRVLDAQMHRPLRLQSAQDGALRAPERFEPARDAFKAATIVSPEFLERARVAFPRAPEAPAISTAPSAKRAKP